MPCKILQSGFVKGSVNFFYRAVDAALVFNCFGSNETRGDEMWRPCRGVEERAP